MAQFIAFAPNVEVAGNAILLVIDTMGLFARLAKTIYARYGITEVHETGWYPQQVYLDVLREIYDQVGQKTLKQIGRQVPDKALWPPNIRSVAEALTSIDAAYRMNHRGGDIGSYTFEQLDQTTGRLICHTPYPCPFDEGMIEGTTRKFAPRANTVKITHEPNTPCRMNDSDRCTYRVVW